jgi:hypothetical protein
MRMLECPGVFTMPVPDGWRALGTPGVCYELLPPRGAGAIHVTVFPPPPGRTPRPHEARALLSTFIGQIRPADPLVVINERAEGPVQRAYARFDGTHENGLPAYWFAGTVLAPRPLPALLQHHPAERPAARLRRADVRPADADPAARVPPAAAAPPAHAGVPVTRHRR